MTKRPSVWLALPAIVALAMFAWFTRDPIVTPLCAVAIALSYTHRMTTANEDTGKGLAWTIAVALFIVVYYIVVIAPGIGQRSAHRELVGGEHVLAMSGLAAAIALARLWHVVDARRHKTGHALALIGLLAVLSGNTYEWNHIYLGGVVLFCVCVTMALFADHGPTVRRQQRFGARTMRAMATLCSMATIAALAVGAVFTLRAAERAIIGWRPALLVDRPPIGFGSGMRIHRNMHLSLPDTIAFTLDGPTPPGYLRLEVFNQYADSRWSSDDSSQPLPANAPVALSVNVAGPDAAVTGSHIVEPHLEVSSTLPLPYGVGLLWPPLTATSCTLSKDGIARCTGQPGAYHWDVDARPSAPVAADAPGELERVIPAAVADALAPFTRGIVGDATAPLNALQAAGQVAQHLRTNHPYSLDVALAKRGDPVVDFVLHQRPGWCEHFASAMVLMLRSVGIPARVVGGFVAEEYSDVARRWIVRLDDAHAWTEVYDPESRQWVAFDPTPSSAAALREPQSLLDRLKSRLDVVWLLFLQLSAAWDRLDLAQIGHKLGEQLWSIRRPIAVILGLFALFGLDRLNRVLAMLRRRVRHLFRKNNEVHPAATYFSRLQAAAARVALPVSPTETITSYARRMRLHPLGSQAADQLDDFAEAYLVARFGSSTSAGSHRFAELEERTIATVTILRRLGQHRK